MMKTVPRGKGHLTQKNFACKKTRITGIVWVLNVPCRQMCLDPWSLAGGGFCEVKGPLQVGLCWRKWVTGVGEVGRGGWRVVVVVGC